MPVESTLGVVDEVPASGAGEAGRSGAEGGTTGGKPVDDVEGAVGSVAAENAADGKCKQGQPSPLNITEADEALT
jgi:hypothetical protein